MKYTIQMPDWAEADSLPSHVEDLADRMRLVIRYSKLNFQHDTGGPFAAGVFETESGRLIAMGVNRVIPCSNSSAHAEMVALSLAQQRLRTFDLGGEDQPSHQLVVNARPCAMCFGAIPWSGVRSVVVAASGQMIEELTGFDEGPIHPDWQQELRNRGIQVQENLLSERAAEVLKAFGQSNRDVYNGRRGRPTK